MSATELVLGAVAAILGGGGIWNWIANRGKTRAPRTRDQDAHHHPHHAPVRRARKSLRTTLTRIQLDA